MMSVRPSVHIKSSSATDHRCKKEQEMSSRHKIFFSPATKYFFLPPLPTKNFSSACEGSSKTRHGALLSLSATKTERIFRSPSFYEFPIWSPHFLLFDFLITLIGKKITIIVWFTLTFAGFSNRYLILYDFNFNHLILLM